MRVLFLQKGERGAGSGNAIVEEETRLVRKRPAFS